MKSDKKILILQKRVKQYRQPLFNGIGEQYDTKVICYTEPAISGNNYSVTKIKHKYLPVSIDFIYNKKLRQSIKEADVIIRSTDFRSINGHIIHALSPKAKQIMWGIGVSASYDMHYDAVDESNLYIKMLRNCDAAIFYYDYPKEKYVRLGADKKKIFVANNTVFVPTGSLNKQPKNILFIGELYPQKGGHLLVDQYYKAYQIDHGIPKLIIVGDGSEKQKLMQTVNNYNIDDKVIFLGKITDDNELKPIFENSIMCVSPMQAGLSVLKSMGFGVPFVTCKDAITGGEISNIKNGQNGIILDSVEELKDVFLFANSKIEYYTILGNNARDYYFNNRTMQHMVQNFINAIEFVLKQ